MRDGHREGGAAPTRRGLFVRRIPQDDGPLELARLRFAQAGLGAELYADTPDQLRRQLRFAPEAPPPTVHLNRDLNVLREGDRRMVGEFGRRFAGEVWGLVVHDKGEMATRSDDTAAAMRELDAELGPDGPWVFLEYAAGLSVDGFAEIGERLRELGRISLCLDVGHVGITRARRRFRQDHPDLDLATLIPTDGRLPDLVGQVQAAVESALPAVLDLTRALGRLGKPLHFHLHDGHPLVPGLSDHFSFLSRLPIPFSYEGRRSLDLMYGPLGLARIVRSAIDACGPERASLTLEIHRSEGRLPLGDVAGLFGEPGDPAEAERTNQWLSVVVENDVLLGAILDAERGGHVG